MKSIFLLLISLLIILMTLMSCGSSKNRTTNIREYSGESILIDYGRFVYEREKCNACHTLSVANKSEDSISLDGYGNSTRSSAFVYFYLKRPKEMIPGSKMPSFSSLHNTKVNRENLKKILHEKSFKREKHLDFAWDELNAAILKYQSKDEDYFADLDDHSDRKYSEVFPLIAYLLSIPSSEEQKIIDSIVEEKRLIELKRWNNFALKSDSILETKKNDTTSIKSGRKIFQANCAVCHGESAQGMIGPNLTDEYWIYGEKAKDIFITISKGRPNGMPEHRSKLEPLEIIDIMAFIRSKKGTDHPDSKDP